MTGIKNFGRTLLTVVLSLAIISPSKAADTSIATLNISGNVPAVFSLTARGYPGDLDLSGNGVVASDRLVGIFHFRYNVDIASLTLQTAEASGLPSNSSGTPYSFGTAFMLKFGACTTIDATYKTAFSPGVGATSLGGAGKDVKSAAASGLTVGRDEECDLTATWGGSTTNLPLAGKYSLNITMTMISN